MLMDLGNDFRVIILSCQAHTILPNSLRIFILTNSDMKNRNVVQISNFNEGFQKNATFPTSSKAHDFRIILHSLFLAIKNS